MGRLRQATCPGGAGTPLAIRLAMHRLPAAALLATLACAAQAAPSLSPDAAQLRAHVLALGDNGARPFGVLDKRRAHL